MWVVRRTLLMNHDVVTREVIYQSVDKVAPLVTYQFEQAPVPKPNILVEEYCLGHVFSECLRFHPLGAVIGRDNDLAILRSCCSWFEWSHKIDTPLLKRFEW